MPSSPFGFQEALGQVPITARCDDTHVQCAMGTPARMAFDELDLRLRQQSDANAVSLVGQPTTALPALSISTPPATTVAATSCCSSRRSKAPAKRLDISSVVCDVDASFARGVFYDFARQDNHPRIEVHPSSLEWASRYALPGTRNGEVSALVSYDAQERCHGLDIHAEIEPVESASRIELDYDVHRKQLDSVLEISCGKTVGRLETRRGVLRRATLKTTHERLAAVSRGVSSLGYSDDGSVKLELFKRKHERGEGDAGPTARRGLGLTVPTLRLVRKERVKEVCVKQWFLNDRFDVHVTMKRASADGEEVTVGAGTHRWDFNVRSVPSDGGMKVPRINLKTKGALGCEVGYEDGKVKLTVGGTPGNCADAKVKLNMEYSTSAGTRVSTANVSCGFYLPL